MIVTGGREKLVPNVPNGCDIIIIEIIGSHERPPIFLSVCNQLQKTGGENGKNNENAQT